MQQVVLNNIKYQFEKISLNQVRTEFVLDRRSIVTIVPVSSQSVPHFAILRDNQEKNS